MQWLLQIGPVFLKKGFLIINVFLLFHNYLQGCLCQDWLKLAQWFWRRGLFNFVNVFSLFHNYLPLEKGRALPLNKLESPSHKDALCQVWLKLAQWFWRRRFLNVIHVFLIYLLLSLVEKGLTLYLNKLQYPLPFSLSKDALCQGWLFQEKKIFKCHQWIFKIIGLGS